MIRKNNKGFTLLELLISIFIATIVVFIGYRVFDKATIDTKNQGNINQGQLTMNNMNEYLTKDIEQSKNVVLSTGGLEVQQKENLSSIDEEFDKLIIDARNNNTAKYIYTIYSNNDENIANYEISLHYKDNKYRYSISRIDFSNIKIDLISEEILESIDKPPFVIRGNDPYEISMQYNSKDDKVVNHKFEVTSRYIIATDDNSGDQDTEEDMSKSTNYLNYCLNKAQEYINKLDNAEAVNLIKEISKISVKEEYNPDDLLIMDDYIEKLINGIINIRENSNKQYLDENQDNLNWVEYYLKVARSIIYNYEDQNNKIDRDQLNKIIIFTSQNLKGDCLTSYPNGAKNKIVSLKQLIMNQKNIGNNNSTSIGTQVDEQGKVIDRYEIYLDNDIIISRIDKMWSMLDKIVEKTWQTNDLEDDINELSQFINDTIDKIIEFEVSLKTYVYTNIPISDNIPEYMIEDINLNAEDVTLKLNEANQILVYIKAQLNNVNYMKINNETYGVLR